MKDQLGRTINLPFPPKRIISLVPSQTELLYELGLEECVVGITKFCIHPENWHRTKQRIGGTKNLNLDIIRQLRPDLIIGNKEENEAGQIRELMNEFPVWMSDIYTLDDAIAMIRSIGSITSKESESEMIASRIISGFRKLEAQQAGKEKIQLLYLIWKDPYMAAGRMTFIHDLLQRAGFVNSAANLDRYPVMENETIRSLHPQIVFFSSEPFPFNESHMQEFKIAHPDTLCMLVDGEMLSWYGPRLIRSAEYLTEIYSKSFRLLNGFEGNTL